MRDLGDALEFIRPQAEKRLSRKDEGALFQILNQYGIRHLRADQRMDYDRPIFLRWIFYELLAAIHACTAIMDRHSPP